MTPGNAIRFAILAAIVMGCEQKGKDGPPGEAGPAGPQGETGPAGDAGAPAAGLVWRDASGELIPTVTQSFSTITFTRVLLDDGAGHLWTVNPTAGRLDVALVPTSGSLFTAYFTEPDCLGDAYVEAGRVPPPGFVFRTGPTGYRALPPTVIVADIQYQSRNGCGNETGTIRGLPLADILEAPSLEPPVLPPSPWTPSVTP